VADALQDSAPVVLITGSIFLVAEARTEIHSLKIPHAESKS
jgi:thiamine pyrophosphate-dependent acetolactate synthase large subunit-like protein